MEKSCSKCGVPLEGFAYNIFVKPILGIRPSKKKGVCNKCENKK